jgi:hypothetical protein
MGFDLGTYLRLRDATMAVIEGVPEACCAGSGAAMVQSYTLLRAEVRSQAGWEHVEEFDRLFPEWDDLPPPRSPRAAECPADDYHRARILLLQLVGWLEGFIEQTQLETEARAYAEARLEKERSTAARRSEAEGAFGAAALGARPGRR